MNVDDVVEDRELKDSVLRLHGYIVDSLRERRGNPYTTPVSVSEIYQDIAPYRSVRGVLRFEMNADYEHALVRLLAGVDNLARLDPPKARERLSRELESPNPDVTLYRHYAACDVVLAPADTTASWVREQIEDEEEADVAYEIPFAMAQDPSPTNAIPDWSALADLAHSAHHEEEEEAEDVEESTAHATYDSGPDPADAQATPAVELEAHGARAENENMAVNEVHTCSYCDSKLPSNRRLRFCPFCGADQSTVPCASCGEALEPGWSFCIACGTPVASVTQG